MLKRHLLLAGILAGSFAITACSPQTEDQAQATAESAGDDIQANTAAAAAEAEAAAQEAGTAVDNAGEAIADGANEVVENSAAAIAEGADKVAAGATDVAANASANQDAEPTAKEAVAEDQKY